MVYNPYIHDRKSIRLANFDYSQCGAYMITICTHHRHNLFGRIENGAMLPNRFGDLVLREWERSEKIRRELELDEFVVMPNHIHGIVLLYPERLGEPPHMLKPRLESQEAADRWRSTISSEDYLTELTGERPLAPTTGMAPHSVQSFVSGLKASITTKINTFRNTRGAAVWQRGFWEHVIRNEKELHAYRQYIHYNPLCWKHDEHHMAE